MSNPDSTSVAYLLASIQRALLNEVTPDLRGVAARVGEDGIHARFIFDSGLTVQSRERVSDIETEVIADYSGLSPVHFVAEYLPSDLPRLLEQGEWWAFLRREATS
jgi:hypothetical protein